MIEIPIIRDAFDIYSRHYSSLGDYSATTIIDSPRRVALFKRYGESVDYTPESQAASLVGTAVHDKMEALLRMANVKYPSYLVERSVAHPVTVSTPKDLDIETGGISYKYKVPADKTWTKLLAGKFDILMDKKHLIDIKTCKTWKLIFDPDKEEWTKQLNIYGWLLRQRGVKVESLTVVAFYLDWIESQSIRNRAYPQAPICEYKIDMWPEEEQEAFIKDRMLKHCQTEDLSDEKLPKCTMKEMWQDPAEYAIFKNEKAKRAMSGGVCTNTDLHGAIAIAQKLPGVSANSYIEIRHEKRKRCDKFCAINKHCTQYQRWSGLTNDKGKNLERFHLGGVL
jgi:hypothetical protein